MKNKHKHVYSLQTGMCKCGKQFKIPKVKNKEKPTCISCGEELFKHPMLKPGMVCLNAKCKRTGLLQVVAGDIIKFKNEK